MDDATLTQATQATRGPVSQRKNLLFWTLLGALLLVVGIAVLEIALRALYREEEAAGDYFGFGGFIQDEELGYRHAPGFNGTIYRRDIFDCPVSISPQGLRQSNFDAQMQYSKRLLVLGDSYVFGVGVKEEAIFASLAQPVLNFEGLGVINGGQSGYCVTQEVKFGMRLAQTVKPSIIVLSLYPNNDIIGDYYKDYENVEVRHGHRLAKDRWLPIGVFDFVRSRSYAWMLLNVSLSRKRVEEQRKAFLRFAKDSTALAMQPTLTALAELHGFCRDNGIKLGVMLLPSAGKSLFDAPLKQALNDEGIPVLDLGERKFGRKNYFQGDAHWNENGHQKAAKYFVSFCQDLQKNS
ncbi:hypothetical protein HUU05_00900 [candidate division KSB1 bacterium]|nr:hypothetical protein [candidate division KSB1 bacterium]